ncbi:hypothetical protein LPJ73_000870 [Coemansia sp. RSA 2703]|nr:hypothetical protein LPJ73_000870 [Coemansia sp. RSA 2703]KAJ2372928.1 hypothetical protein IW150_003875 [Coemansia sp. RSA 2607]KAJ2397151.1 hypothetical protein GGI05_000782 [Coemansia sp. RSA 2603]
MSDNTRSISAVVVGGSYAGAAAAKKLADLSKNYPGLKVTLIDKCTHYFHAVGFPKALVDAKYADKAFLPFAGMFHPSSQHEFVNDTLAKVIDAHHLELTSGRTIYYDYLVLATGGQAPGPINVVGKSKEEGLAEISELRAGIESASSILIVGGGAVGVETAGFVAASYPGKKVTLVHSGQRLLPGNFREGLGSGAKEKLEQLGVQVVLNERIEIPDDSAYAARVESGQVVHGSSGNEYTVDVLIKAVGFTVHSEFVEPLEEIAGKKLRADDGPKFIHVLPTLQLASNLFPNVFVAGDANDLPMTAKYGFKAEMQGGTAAANIRRMIECGFDKDFAHATNVDAAAAADVAVPSLGKWTDYVDAILVPIGPDLGVAQALKVDLGCTGLANFFVRQLKTRDFMLWLRKGYFKYRHSK